MDIMNAIISNDMITLMHTLDKYDVNILINDTTPLITSVIYSNIEMTTLLLQHGADPNLKSGTGLTPLMYAPDPFIADLLISYGAYVNIEDNDGNTALLHHTGDYAIIKLLLDKGADINHINYSGQTVLIKNISEMYILKLIMDHKKLDLRAYEQGRLALIHAKLSSDNLISKYLESRFRELSYIVPMFKNRYEYVNTLGAGVMGIVILVRDIYTHQYLALKITPGTDKPEYDVYDNEIVIVKYIIDETVQHDNVVKYFDTFVDHYDTIHFNYIVMEYIRGITINDLNKKYELSDNEKLKLVVQLLDGLSFLSAYGILNYDLNISNILIRVSDMNLKIIDLGLACFIHDREPNCQNYDFPESVYHNIRDSIESLVNDDELFHGIIEVIGTDIAKNDYSMAMIKLQNYIFETD